jgi:Dolichyl-phosphate-mannose-protein mannosyltransferase
VELFASIKARYCRSAALLIPTSKPKWWPQALCSLLFFFIALPFLSYPGPQNDEVLFAAPLYRIDAALYHLRILKHDVPLMTMSYVGALKTWIHVPIFRIFGTSRFSLRIAPLVFGSLTVWILFHWLERAHSRRAAWIGALLVATDTMFLLTTCFDWGPVALQHFLAVLGLVLVVHFHHTRGRWFLAAGFLCFGLAFWDKALFAWIFGGLVCGVVLAFPRELWRDLTWKNSVIASVALIIGASPLITYNVLNQFPTFHSTSGFTTRELYPKTFVLADTWTGRALLGYLVNEDTAPKPRGPRNAVETLSFRLRSLAGEHRRNALGWAALVALLLLLPALWWPASRRLVVFSLTVCVVAWLQMGATKDAGAAAHHVVLLWPFPHVALAVIFAEASLRLHAIGHWLLGIGMALLIGANLLLTNQHFYQLARNGAAGSWSDAMYPLSLGLVESHPRRIAILDWGIVLPLDVLDGGRLPLVWASAPFETAAPTEAPDPGLWNDPATLWLSHAAGYEQYAGVNARVEAFVQRAGFTKVPVRTYYDTNGRAVFETFCLAKR